MLTRIVRLSLLAEIAAYAGLGAWLHAAHGAGIGALLLAALAVALGARFALVCVTAFLGWWYRAPRAAEHRIGAAGTLRLLLGEYRALLADNLYYLPFESLALRPDPPPRPGAVPVVLVHGYLANRGYFRPMVRWLVARGVGPVHAPNFRSVFSTIEHFAAELHRELERIVAGAPGAQVVLVCHSMGGLAARRYLQERGAGRVARLVTIGSPHHGTRIARLGIGPHARQMRPGSDFLTALEAAERAAPPPLPAVSIYSTHDNLVAPQDTSRLPWAENLALAGIGHVELVACERVFARVMEEVRAGQAAARR